jgi:hypothetical protein
MRPVATRHDCAESNKIGLAMLASTVAVAISIPLAPKVNFPEPATSTAVLAPLNEMPNHVTSAPSVSALVNELDVQVAMSAAVGAVPPQLAPALRSVPAASLITVAAEAFGCNTHTKDTTDSVVKNFAFTLLPVSNDATDVKEKNAEMKELHQEKNPRCGRAARVGMRLSVVDVGREARRLRHDYIMPPMP